MSFAGPGPEIINGRLAMLGVTAALGCELIKHESFISQFQDHSGVIVAIAALFAVGSLVPMLKGGLDVDARVGPFERKAEMANGRCVRAARGAFLRCQCCAHVHVHACAHMPSLPPSTNSRQHTHAAAPPLPRPAAAPP